MGRFRLIRSIAGLVGAMALVVLVGLTSSALSSSPSPTLERSPTDMIERPSIRLDFQSLDEEGLAAIHEKNEKPTPGDRLRIPPELPGADAPPLQMPRRDPDHPEAHDAAMQALYPPLPPLGPNIAPQMAAGGQPIALVELQRIAQAENPLLRSASAAIRAAEGSTVQAGLLPNPIVGFSGDNIDQNRTSGQLGGFVSQEFVFLCKIRLAQAVAQADRDLANQTYRTIENEVIAGVRRGYFAVLAAQETMRVQEALGRFTDEVYRVQVDLVRSGQSAAYEPLQLRVMAYQSRAQLVQARNRYVAAWKQLAATVGRPDMPPLLLAGSIDQPMPLIRHEALRAKILAGHTSIAAARIALDKAHKALRLAETNRIPNVTVAGTVQHDNTTGLGNTTYNVSVGVPVPIFNRNQGNILRARAGVEKAAADIAALENDLSAKLAYAFERYDNQRRLVVWYRDRILPDQVLAYRGVYGRHRIDPERVGFGEVVAAQQTLVSATTTYLQTLGDAWDSVVELGKLAQAEDLFSVSDETYPTSPTCTSGSCPKHIADLLPWPDVMPMPAPMPTAPVPGALPDPSLPPVVIATPQSLMPSAVPATPTSGPGCECETTPTFLPTVGPVEKSTKRRWFLSWPMRRTETEPAPVMLPPTEESCFPPGVSRPMPMPMPTSAPELLPAPGPAAPPKLPVTPAATPKKASSSIPLPEIFEGPLPTRPMPRVEIYNGDESEGSIQLTGATIPLPPSAPSAPITPASNPPSAGVPTKDLPPVRVPPLRYRLE
jgi:cobalt-zinc-cadmium efflux system outer membrane protein